MSNRIELNLNDKLVLREKDEKGKFMIVKQGIKGNKNINENAYRLVYRLIRDFLSGKAFNSKVIYNTETKKLEYGDDLKNPDTQQRNIQIDIQPDQIKQYTQITGYYSKPNLAILKLDADDKLNIEIYIPNDLIDKVPNDSIDKESIYYAKLINEIQKIKEPSLQNLFENVEKRYTFSEKEPAYSVFEKLNDLTNKLENKHFKQLTVEYYINKNENEKTEFEYSMNKKPKAEDHNLKYLPFTSYLQGFIPTYDKEEIEETSLGFLLDLAIRRYDKVHDEFKEQFTPIEAGRETPAAEKAAPEAAPAATTQDKSLEIIREEIITKLQNIADSKGNTYPEQDQANVVRNLKIMINIKNLKTSIRRPLTYRNNKKTNSTNLLNNMKLYLRKQYKHQKQNKN